MKKVYLEPVAECVPMIARCEMLSTTSFEGVNLEDATEIDWSGIMLNQFDGLL